MCSNSKRAINLLILHINSSFGGAERTTKNLLKYFNREKICHITMVSSGSIKKYFPDLYYDKFIDVEPYGIKGWFVNLRSLISDAKAVSKILKQESPDVILSVMHYPSALLVFSSIFFGIRAKKVVTFRGPVYEHMRYFESGLMRKLFLKVVLSITSRCADKIIVPSSGMKTEILKHFFGKKEGIEVIPNGIDFCFVESQKSKPIDDCEILINKKIPVLCSAARLSPEKNLSLLLKAFSLIRKKVESYLIFIGSGTEEKKLQNMAIGYGIKDSVFFLGEKENVFPYIYHSDIYIHTCFFEGFP